MDVPTDTLRQALLAVQQISGGQYELLLTRAGLARFRQTLPGTDMHPVATRAELARLFATVYEMLGEPLTRLFMRNIGTAFAAGLVQSPAWGVLAEQGRRVPGAQRQGWFVEQMAQVTGRHWSPTRLWEDGAAWYLELEYCPNCAGLHGLQAPICANVEVVWGAAAKLMIEQRVHIVEVACHGMGAPHCVFAIAKEG
jgi:hypothetical protein